MTSIRRPEPSQSNFIKVMLMLFFILGYSQLIPSRDFRRSIARTEFHRAWLAGNQGNIGEADGVLYRNWHTNRKQHKNATLKQAWQCTRQYYGLDRLDRDGKSRFLIAAILKDIFQQDVTSD